MVVFSRCSLYCMYALCMCVCMHACVCVCFKVLVLSSVGTNIKCIYLCIVSCAVLKRTQRR